MNRLNAAVLCLVLLAGCGDESKTGGGGGGTTATGEKDQVFISGAKLIVGDGSQPIEKGIILITNGVIEQVGKDKEFYAPKGSASFDVEGRTIMPTLVNLHAYPGLSNAGDFGSKNYNRESLTADLSRYNYYGVGALVAGADSEGLAFQVRDEQKQGKSAGAQLHSSGRGIAAKGSSGVLDGMPILIGSADEGRKAVSQLVDLKADVVVLWANGLKSDAISAVIDEAHKHNLKALVDAPDLSEAKDAVRAGANALISSVTDKEVDDELISMMKEKKTALAPSLTSLEAKFTYADKPKWPGEQAMREVYDPSLSAYLTDDVTVNKFKRNSQLAAYRQQYETATKNLKKLGDAGVAIAFGSGSGLADTFPGYFEHRELELMVKAGLSPMAAIKAATSVSAEVLGAKDLGTLVAGKKGSFMIVSNNPSETITDSKGIDDVYIDGKQLDRAAIIKFAKTKRREVTQQQRTEEAKTQAKEAQDAADAKLKHYGITATSPGFPTGSSITVAAGLILQTPKYSKTNASSGPPYRVSVTLAGASGDALRAFYADTTFRSWTSAGGCWEKANPAEEGKKFRACAEPGSGQITLNIAVQ